MRIVSVVGARPNFMKLAPVDRELAKRGDVEHIIVHTGQHYDPEMSDTFFEELWIPVPDYHLGVGSGSHALQTATAMQRLEPVLVPLRPDLVLVYGDANSTLAAALVAAKLGLPVGHVEAGLRGGDRTLPEEINRVVTDRLADVLLAPSRDAGANLLTEGVASDRVHFVGNVMIDSLCWALARARERDTPARYHLREAEYVVVTLHHPSNVDDPAILRTLLDVLRCVSRERPVVFPLHPRARKQLRAAGVTLGSEGDLRLIDSLSYGEMLGLVAGAALVITDSGGLQEETTFLGVPCLTVQPHTARPITCSHGTNRLVRPRGDVIRAAVARALARHPPVRPTIERWDGRAAERIVQVLCDGERFPLDASVAAAPQFAHAGGAVPEPFETAAVAAAADRAVVASA
jgi:UDP-N-acetylglucosamine 2-epimerase (non-hydrolysing)